ncbi:Znfx1 [Symbiodinium sp. CCMP2592]|nr:Znfx1 [Symbiodinium sp. CCMP2592]
MTSVTIVACEPGLQKAGRCFAGCRLQCCEAGQRIARGRSSIGSEEHRCWPWFDAGNSNASKGVGGGAGQGSCSWITSSIDDNKCFIQQLSHAKGDLGKQILDVNDQWQQCWTASADLPSEVVKSLVTILCKIPPSASPAPPPPARACQATMQLFLREEKKGSPERAVAAVEVVLNAIGRLLTLEWDASVDEVRESLQKVLEDARGCLQIRQDHEDEEAAKRITLLSDELKKPSCIKVKPTMGSEDEDRAVNELNNSTMESNRQYFNVRIDQGAKGKGKDGKDGVAGYYNDHFMGYDKGHGKGGYGKEKGKEGGKGTDYYARDDHFMGYDKGHGKGGYGKEKGKEGGKGTDYYARDDHFMGYDKGHGKGGYGKEKGKGGGKGMDYYARDDHFMGYDKGHGKGGYGKEKGKEGGKGTDYYSRDDHFMGYDKGHGKGGYGKEKGKEGGHPCLPNLLQKRRSASSSSLQDGCGPLTWDVGEDDRCGGMAAFSRGSIFGAGPGGAGSSASGGGYFGNGSGAASAVSSGEEAVRLWSRTPSPRSPPQGLMEDDQLQAAIDAVIREVDGELAQA